MPLGCVSILPYIIVRTGDSDSFLDIGIGYGINGAALRNWRDQGNPKSRIVGVEIFEPYRNALWSCYDEVIIKDIREYEFEDFDTIIMTDVIEHLEKEEGIQMLYKIKKHTNKISFVSTPKEYRKQGSVNDNKNEEHLCVWHEREFELRGFEILHTKIGEEFGHNMILAYFKKG